MRHHADKCYRAKKSFSNVMIEPYLAANNGAIKNKTATKDPSLFQKGFTTFMAVLRVQKIDPKNIG
jgi:hypothetical protein